MTATALQRSTELDRTSWPEFRDRVQEFVADAESFRPRSYPGYPRWALTRCRPRPWPSLESTLCSRRSATALSFEPITRPKLSRLLQFSHAVNADHGRGPTPSAGGLQALELYVVNWTDGWLPAGLYHYDRAEHCLAQLAAGARRADWEKMIPSLQSLTGGALLWILVGDGGRASSKYGERGWRFLILEAGHLMQNLCLMSARLGCTTAPLGGFFEAEIAGTLTLPTEDVVLYVGVCGRV